MAKCKALDRAVARRHSEALRNPQVEQTATLGGSLDGSGSPDHGYVIRGGRMFTYEAYTCTFDLLSFIPSLAAIPEKTVSDEDS